MCRADEVGVAEGRALEREANVFAAELLMPEELMRTAWDGDPDIDALAARFRASGLAVRWRLFSFGLCAAPGSAQGSR
jgi:Zn-dependent peptidase ImmA (M78 family)